MRKSPLSLAAATPGSARRSTTPWPAKRIGTLLTNLQAVTSGPEHTRALATAEDMRAYLAAERDLVALVAFSVGPDGAPLPDTVLSHNADQPLPLASTVKILLLAAYAEQVADGRIEPTEPVTLADWERHHLPGTDGGAHEAALAALGIPTDAQGFAADQTATVPIDRLAWTMIRYSDNAAADYLLDRVGAEAVAALIAREELTAQALPLPIVGRFLSFSNHRQPRLDNAALAQIDIGDPA